jgi:DNA topoisomerase IB
MLTESQKKIKFLMESEVAQPLDITLKHDVTGEARDEHGRWTEADNIPAEPGSTPIKPGYVRLYHQTSEENLKSILRSGLDIEHAKGIEGPRAVYASESGFYGKPDSRPTIEFQVPKEKWSDPFVLQDVAPADIIAGHLPWHHQARYMEANNLVKDALAGKFDYLLKPREGVSDSALEAEDDAGKALLYIKRKYASMVQKFNLYHGDDGRFVSGRPSLLTEDMPKQAEWLHSKAKGLGYADADEMVKLNPRAFTELAQEWRTIHALKPPVKVYPSGRYHDAKQKEKWLEHQAHQFGFDSADAMQEQDAHTYHRLLRQYPHRETLREVEKRDVSTEARDEHGRWAQTVAYVTKQPDGTWQYESGKLLSEADQARMKELVVPPGWHQVMLNPDPTGEVQVIAKNKKEQIVRIYSEEHGGKASATKFARVKALHQALPEIRKKLYADFESVALGRLHKDTVAAVLLIDQSGLRPGSTKDTDTRHQAYGATTLQGQHVKIEGDKLRLSFTGKKGVRINKTVEHAGLARYLEGKGLEKGKAIFDTSEGKALDYWKAIAGDKFKLKDLRTWHGTAVAWKWAKKLGAPKDAKTFKKWVQLIAQKVSSHLGNTPSVAKSAYIDPAVFARLSGLMSPSQKEETEAISLAEMVDLMDEYTASEFDHYSWDWREHPEFGEDPNDEEVAEKAESFKHCDECTGGLAPWCKANRKCADQEMGGPPLGDSTGVITVTAKAAVEMVGDTHLMPFVSFKNMMRDHTMNAMQLTASLHTSRLSSYGFVAEARALGVEEYAISEQLDSRICPICKIMHGKRFKVASAKSALSDIFSVQTQDDLRSLQPWPKQSKREVAKFAAMSNDELVARNWHIPPFHPRCRGLLVHVGKVPRIEDTPSFIAAMGKEQPLAHAITQMPEKVDNILGTEKQRAAIQDAYTDIKTQFLIDPVEHGVGLDREGNVVLRVKGTKGHIDIKEAELHLLENGTFVHNHPLSGSLSVSDLVVAAERHLEQIIAIGTDGSEYIAFDMVSAGSFKSTQKYYVTVQRAMADVLFKYLYPGVMGNMIQSSEADIFHDHFINQVLGKFDVMGYRAKLGADAKPAIEHVTTYLEEGGTGLKAIENEMVAAAHKAIKLIGGFNDLPFD